MTIHLPENVLVEEILSRLPAKALLRFRSVCKSWRSHISSTYFVKLQLKRASDIGFNKFIVWNNNSGFRRVDCHTSNSLDFRQYASQLFIPLRPSFSCRAPRFRILGSCNGLLLVSTDTWDRFDLWNPCTNEYKEIPPLKHQHRNSAPHAYGFGYDTSTDDYKVLIINFTETSSFYGMIFIFSLRKGSWVCFQDVNISCFTTYPCGVFFNGAIHWPSTEYANDESVLHSIVSFELADNSLKKIHVPGAEKYRMYDSRLSVLDGFLCLSAPILGNWYNLRGRQTILIMEKYGVSSSWTELTTIWSWYGDTFSPLCFTRQGKLLLKDSANRLVCFNLKSNSLKVWGYETEAHVYVETLVSPRLYANKQKRKRNVMAKS